MSTNESGTKSGSPVRANVAPPAKSTTADQTTNAATTGTGNTKSETTEAKPSDKSSKLDKLRERASAASEKKLIASINKLELFDSTKAGEWTTTGAPPSAT